MDALINLFWTKYSDLRDAVRLNRIEGTAALEAEIDLLLSSIFSSKANDSATIQAQFQFALDLLNEEADDGGCVRRNGYLLRMLVERYVVNVQSHTPENILSGEDVDVDPSGLIDDATSDGFLDDAVLNRIDDRIMVIAPGYRVFYSNEKNARHLGIGRDNLIGRHLAEFTGIHRFRNEYKPMLDRCLSGVRVNFAYAEEQEGKTVVIRCRMYPCRSGSSLIGALLVEEETEDRRKRPAVSPVRAVP